MEENRTLTELAAQLKEKYLEDNKIARLFYPDHPLPIEQCYLDLALIEDKVFHDQKKDDQSNTREESRNYFLHSYERIQHSQCKLTPEQLLTECHTIPKRIYIEGAAGAGKTTLSQFIAYQWGKDHSVWKHYDFLFRIRLRDLTAFNYSEQKIDFIEFLEKECFRFGFSDSLTENEKNSLLRYLKSKTKKVLFILDGYDELSLESNTIKMLWNNLIDSTYDFIITSRPGMRKTDLRTHLNIAVLGFNDEQVEKYVQYFFNPQHTPDAQSQDAHLCLQILSQNTIFRSLMHIPIQLELLCSIWGNDIKQTKDIMLTQLYNLLFEKILKRCEQKKLEHEKNKQLSINNIKEKDLFNKYSIYMEYLEYLAYLGMQKQVIVLSTTLDNEAYEATVPSHQDSNEFYIQIGKLGFIKRDRTQAEFIHLTFQEFFAARYIAQRLYQADTHADIKSFICQYKYEPHLQVMWWFVAGIIRDNKKVLEKFLILLSEEPKALLPEIQLCLLVRCIDESRVYKGISIVEKSLDFFKRNWHWNLQHWEADGLSNLVYIYRNCLAYSSSILYERIDSIKGIKEKLLSVENKFDQITLLEFLQNCEINELWFIEASLKLLKIALPSYQDRVLQVLKKLYIKNERFIEALHRLLQDKEVDIRATAVEILGKLQIKDEWSIEVLQKALGDNEGEVRTAAVKALGELQIKTKWFIEVLRKALRDNEGNIRAVAVKVLGELQIEDKWFIENLLGLLYDEDVHVYCNTRDILNKLEIKDKSFTKILRKLLQDKNENVRYYAIKLLSKLNIKDKWFITFLLKSFSDKKKSVGYLAAKVLGKLEVNNQWLIAALQKLLLNKKGYVRYLAAKVLGKLEIRDKWFIESLQKLLQDTYHDAQSIAVKILEKMEIKDKWFIEALQKLLQDEGKNIQDVHEIEFKYFEEYTLIRVVKILAKLEIKEAWYIMAMLDFLYSFEDFLCYAVHDILKKFKLKEQWYIKKLLKLLTHFYNGYIAVDLLSNVDLLDKWYINSLRKLLNNKDEDARCNAVELLSKLYINEAWYIKALIKLLKLKDKNIRYRAVVLLTSDYLVKDMSVKGWLEIFFKIKSNKIVNEVVDQIIRRLPYFLVIELCKNEALVEWLIRFFIMRIFENKDLIYISDNKIYYYEYGNKKFQYSIVDKVILNLLNQDWKKLYEIMQYPIEILALEILDKEIQLEKTVAQLHTYSIIRKLNDLTDAEQPPIKKQKITHINTVTDNKHKYLNVIHPNTNVYDLITLSEFNMQEQTEKYDVFIAEIKEIQEAIDILISHVDLKTRVTQELQNISSELVKAKSHAIHTNKLIRAKAQATYDNCIKTINYLKTMIAQEKNYPVDELNQIIPYLENIAAKVSPKVELYTYSITQMQEVQSQGLFFTQRYLSNALNEHSPLGQDFKALLETIKTTMGSNRYSCFISYAKPIDETSGPDRFIPLFLDNLHDHLLLAGFNLLLDSKCIEPGENVEAYMKNVLICNYWLLIGTPSLTHKLDQNAYIKFETGIENIRKVNKLNDIYPMIPLLLVGNAAQSLPWYKQSHNYIDLTQSSYLTGLKKLLQALSRIPEQKYNDLWKAFEDKYPEHMQALSAPLIEQNLQNEQQKEQQRNIQLENKQADVYQGFSQPITNAEGKTIPYKRPVSGVHMWQEDKKSDTSNLESIHYEYKYHPEYKRSDIEFEIEDGCDPKVFNFIENLYQKNKNSSSQTNSIENINQRQFIETILDHKPATNTNRPISSELKVHETNFSIKVKSKKSSSPNYK